MSEPPKEIVTSADELLREPTAREWVDIRQRQMDFLKKFGDFEGTRADGIWIGVSPDGLLTGFYFNKPDGTEVRVSIGSELMPPVIKNCCIATQIASERARRVVNDNERRSSE